MLEELGAGGMGQVVSAYDPQLDRKVAIKLVRPDSSGPLHAEESHARMVREAQAMARVSHPNVVAVHEVGTFQARVFLVMEQVEGSTLTAWMEQEHDWPEVVEVFVAAGRGLAAAHEARLVHRDFKPDNVLIGDDGRVRVTDFGLVGRTELDGLAEDLSISSEISETADTQRRALDVTLTRTGTLIGTPRYMAPEQLQRLEVDARTDQFSFCVSLYEALYGYRPFEAGNLRQLIAAVTRGRILDPPEDTEVPPWLHELVLRGLSVDPDDRFESMSDLLAELGRDRTEKKGPWIPLAAAVGVSGLMLLAYHQFFGAGATDKPPAVCQIGAEQLAGTWDDSVKESITASFAKIDLKYASDVGQRAMSILDRFAADWVRMRKAACVATKVDESQSAEALDLRMRCLDRRANELGALTKQLQSASKDTVAKAIEASHALTPISVCANVERLRKRVPLPDNPARRAEIQKLQKALARTKVLTDLGSYKESLELARSLDAPVAKVRFPPLTAELFYARGNNEHRLAKKEEASKSFMKAVNTAEAARADHLAAQSWIALVFVDGFLRRDAERGRMWAERAKAAITRYGGNAQETQNLLGRLVLNMGALQYGAGKMKEAFALWKSSLARWTEAHGETSQKLLGVLNNLSVVASLVGQERAGLEFGKRSMRIAEATVGKKHPLYASVVDNYAGTLRDFGELVRARKLYAEAIEVRRTTLGAEHPTVGYTFSNLGNLLLSMGKPTEALEALQKSVEIHSQTSGPESASVGHVLVSIGTAYRDLGRHKEALASHRKSLGILQRTLGPDHFRTAYPHIGLGEVYGAMNKPTEALKELRKGLAIWKTKLGPENKLFGYAYQAMGLAYLVQGKHAEAVENLERAMKIRKDADVEIEKLAVTRFNLARALWLQNRDRPRAIALAETARRELASIKGLDPKEGEKVEAWLAKRKR